MVKMGLIESLEDAETVTELLKRLGRIAISLEKISKCVYQEENFKEEPSGKYYLRTKEWK